MTQRRKPRARKNARQERKSPYRYITRYTLNAGSDAHLAGEEKYGPWDFLDGHNATELLEAMMRHISLVLSGEDHDADCSKRVGRPVHHLGCVIAGCNMYLTQLGIGTLVDDRPKQFKKRKRK